MATMKLSLAGRVTGLMSDWFVNDVPPGMTVRKDVIDNSAVPENPQVAENKRGERETDGNDTALERLRERAARIYGSLVSTMVRHSSTPLKPSRSYQVGREQSLRVRLNLAWNDFTFRSQDLS